MRREICRWDMPSDCSDCFPNQSQHTFVKPGEAGCRFDRVIESLPSRIETRLTPWEKLTFMCTGSRKPLRIQLLRLVCFGLIRFASVCFGLLDSCLHHVWSSCLLCRIVGYRWLTDLTAFWHILTCLFHCNYLPYPLSLRVFSCYSDYNGNHY